MWFFSHKTDGEKYKSQILDLKKIKVGRIKFTIRRINPFLDFTADRIPQIFTDLPSKFDEVMKEKDLKAIDENIKPVLKAGIYSPVLQPVGKGEEAGHEPGLTLSDLFIDREIAYKLFSEIMEHSLNRFKGLSKLFFWIKVRLWRFTLSPANMEKRP